MCGCYPNLAEIIDPDNPNTRVLPPYQKLRDHAVELARQDVTTELTALHTKGDTMDSQLKSRKKKNPGQTQKAYAGRWHWNLCNG